MAGTIREEVAAADFFSDGFLVVTFAFDRRKLPHSGSAKLVDESLRGHGVYLVIGCPCNECAYAVEIKLFLGKLGKNVRTLRFKAEHLCSGDIVEIRIEQEDAVALFVKDLRSGTRPRIGSGEEDSTDTSRSQAKPARERGCSQTV